MTSIECGICARWVVPVTEAEGKLKVIENGAVGVDKGKIVFVGTWSDFSSQYIAERVLKKEGDCVIMPGMLNLHAHLGMHLLKGQYDDYLLHDWLQRIWPVEEYFMMKDEDRSRRFQYLNALMACYESALEGVTTINDMYFSAEMAEKAAKIVGLDVISGMSIMDFQNGTVDKMIKDEYEHLKSGKSKILCIHSLYTSNSSIHDTIAQWRKEFPSLKLHIHVNEACGERGMQKATYPSGISVIDRLEEMGCLNNKLIGAHMVDLTDEEIEKCGAQRVNAVHCPRSNMKLANGLAQTRKMIDAGMNVALGTDSAVSNNGLSILDEMTNACFVGKIAARAADSIKVDDAIRMATINGAVALGLEDVKGSLAVGKDADIAVVDLNPNGFYFPINTNPLSHLVYTHRRLVTDTFKMGRQIVKDGEVISFDLDREEVQRMMEEIETHVVMTEGILKKLQAK